MPGTTRRTFLVSALGLATAAAVERPSAPRRNPFRETALRTIAATKAVQPFDFLAAHGIDAPVARVAGGLPGAARVFFPGAFLGMDCDLLVVWTIADFPNDRRCSTYYDPTSPWYQVFYGAYGVRARKPNGTPWGYAPDGRPDFEELFRIPRKDYDDLTAGQLGCPPAKRCFEVLDYTSRVEKPWDVAAVRCRIPSGVHHAASEADERARYEAWLAADGVTVTGWGNPAYYLVFGVPDARMVPADHPEYEPVTMRGELYFRHVAEVTGEALTLVWGACCPDTPGGTQLLGRIVTAMRRDYALP